MRIIVAFFLFLLMGDLYTSVEAKGTTKLATSQKVQLHLLEPIAPQKHEGETEIISSNLGEILNDPKNEALKAVKVLGKKKRIQGESQRVTKITWEEVALDAEPSPELAARGVQVPAKNSLKEPIKIPLQSAFLQKAEVVPTGTPIEAKGDVDALLAAARSLLIRAQKQGYKINPIAMPVSSSVRTEVLSSHHGSADSSRQKDHDEVARGGTTLVEGSVAPGQTTREGREATFEGAPKASKRSPDSSFSPRRDQGFSSNTTSSGAMPVGAAPTPRDSSFYSSNGSPYRGSGMDFSYHPWSPPKRSKEDDRRREDTASPSPVVVQVGDGSTLSDAAFTGAPARRGTLFRTPVSGRSPAEGHGSDDERREDETEDREDNESFLGSPHDHKSSHKNMRSRAKAGYGRDDDEFNTGEGFEGRFGYPLGGRADRDEDSTEAPPVIRVDYDFDVCMPRIDWATKQVILQAKALTFRNGVKINESDCADTPKRFAIQKDYLCDTCEDVIEKNTTPMPGNFGFAYATYRPYWLDEASKKTYLKDPEKDEKHPFALQEEGGKCTYALDIDAKTATPQSELVYYNRAKQKVLAEGCRPSLGAKPIAISATQKGCGIIHDFAQNRSIQQQRLVYSVEGVEHEVVPCHDVGGWMDHEFDQSICKPLIDHTAKMQQPFARRFITTEQGKLFISECEPYGSRVELGVDTDICSIQPFHHDFTAKQSYRMGRYYYDHPLKGRKYVTPCHPLADSFPHKKKLVGYEHDDARRISRSKIEDFIEVDGTPIVIKPAYFDDKAVEASYTRQGERFESTAYQVKMTDRCYQEQRFKKHIAYQRIDGSEYLERTDDKVQSVDRCTRTKETKYEASHISAYYALEIWECPNETALRYGLKKGDYIFYPLSMWSNSYNGGVGMLFYQSDKILHRIKILYPDSPTPEYTDWSWYGYYKDHTPHFPHGDSLWDGTGRVTPPYQEKVWKRSERDGVSSMNVTVE